MGAYEVAANGDFANWKVKGAKGGGIGGAIGPAPARSASSDAWSTARAAASRGCSRAARCRSPRAAWSRWWRRISACSRRMAKASPCATSRRGSRSGGPRRHRLPGHGVGRHADRLLCLAELALDASRRGADRGAGGAARRRPAHLPGRFRRDLRGVRRAAAAEAIAAAPGLSPAGTGALAGPPRHPHRHPAGAFPA